MMSLKGQGPGDAASPLSFTNSVITTTSSADEKKMSTASPPPSSNATKEENNNNNIHNKPPTKPRTRSNYHLESNPFEVSFSQPPSAANNSNGFAPPSPRMRPTSRDGHDSKPKLPPIAAMASPSAATEFAWAFGSGGDC